MSASQPARARRRPAVTAETSAGGLVAERDGDAINVLLIGKRDRAGRMVWSLPKGHVEEGESLTEAAQREVTEETGIEASVMSELGTIDYWFVARGTRIHKTVHHFLLRPTGGALSAADVEIEQVAWVPLEEARQRLQYADERKLLERVPELLTEWA